MTNELIFLVLLAVLLDIVVHSIFSLKILTAIENNRPTPAAQQTEPFVTSTNPALTNEAAAGSEDDSIIVNPKSPQLIAWEEEEAVRKINLKPTT